MRAPARHCNSAPHRNRVPIACAQARSDRLTFGSPRIVAPLRPHASPPPPPLTPALATTSAQFAPGRFDVFLSYAWGARAARKTLADEVYRALRAAGLSVWLDEAEMGLDLAASMTEGIVKSGVVVVLASPDYAASPNCMFELRSAVAAGKPLVTCCVEPGFWKCWGLAANGSGTRAVPDDHEFVTLARLTTHLFVDLGAAAAAECGGHGPATAGAGSGTGAAASDGEAVAAAAATRRAMQAPEAMPRLLRLLAEARTQLRADEEAAALRSQERSLSLRAKAQAALEAAAAARGAAAARLAEAEVGVARRMTEARRKTEAALQRHKAASADLGAAAEGEADGGEAALDRVTACQAQLRAARAEQQRVEESGRRLVAEARAALAACMRAREEAAAVLATMRHEMGVQ